jgi:DNA modification methylase
VNLLVGDCREVMPTLAAESVDAIITDPPYGLEFMGKGWDHGVPGVAFWIEALRVLKPGGHLLAFGGTRTHHRLMCAIEDAGFGIRDCLMWLYGSGFPKSLDVSKAMDKAAGAEREIVGRYQRPNGTAWNVAHARENDADIFKTKARQDRMDISAPTTDLAREWQGWGTALKPAWEPIILARKPLIGTVAANVEEYGTGAINVDGCRVGYQGDNDKASATPQGRTTAKSGALAGGSQNERQRTEFERPELVGRWPANVCLDEEAAAMLDAQSGVTSTTGKRSQASRDAVVSGTTWGTNNHRSSEYPGDTGGASRFFYTAKASRAERNAGLEGMPEVACGTMEDDSYDWSREAERGRKPRNAVRANHHPTVKPVSLCRWLVRLITPPGGIVLDPFMGSGTTGIACVLEGFSFIGIEQEIEYLEIARRRIEHAQGPMFAAVEVGA